MTHPDGSLADLVSEAHAQSGLAPAPVAEWEVLWPVYRDSAAHGGLARAYSLAVHDLLARSVRSWTGAALLPLATSTDNLTAVLTTREVAVPRYLLLQSAAVIIIVPVTGVNQVGDAPSFGTALVVVDVCACASALVVEAADHQSMLAALRLRGALQAGATAEPGALRHLVEQCALTTSS